jgi:RND family efflux transporter MFP subunit
MIVEIVVTGEFRAYQSVDVHAKVAGYLKQISVDVGDRVRAGQVLATLEIPEMAKDLEHAVAERKRSTADLARTKSELMRAQSNLQLADLAYSRLSNVNATEPGLVARQEIDEAMGRKRSAEAQVSSARAGIDVGEQQIEVSKAAEARVQTLSAYTQIVAPFAGVVTKRFADTGAMIQAGTASNSQALPVVRIAQIDRLRLVIPVPEAVVAKIKPGKEVSIRVGALNKTIMGRVSRYTGDVQPATRTMEAEVDVPNPRSELMPGMFADVLLTVEKHEHAVALPVQALFNRDGKKMVLVISPEGIVETRQVQTGIETASKTEALQGVSAGDRVVIGNKGELKDGDKVEAKLAGSN